MLENKSLSFSFIFYLKKNRSGRPGHLPKQVTRLDTYSLMKAGELLFKWIKFHLNSNTKMKEL